MSQEQHITSFITMKAGCQRALADVEPGDEALVITRTKDGLNLYSCGGDSHLQTIIIGMCGWAQQEVYHAATKADE